MYPKLLIFLFTLFLTMPAMPGYSGTEAGTSSTSTVDLSGVWQGEWSSSVFGDDVLLNLSQSGMEVSGTLKLGLNCFASGSVSGKITGNSFRMEVKNSDNSVLIYSGSLLNPNSASGSWSQQSGSCPLSEGEWELSRKS